MENLYKIQNLKHEYKWNRQSVPILRDLSFDLERGCFSCFVGPSGTGKTTLLNILGLIENPLNGNLIFCGDDLAKASEKVREKIRLHKIGFVFQSFYLIPTLTVFENTSYFLPQLGHSREKSRKWALDVLALLGLENHIDKRPGELSGGERQRVAIARAIAKKPTVVLADEPTANLDSETATRIIKAFKELQCAEGTSFIFSTHDPQLVEFARTVFNMKDGLIQSRVDQ